jgi:signal peptidase I
MTVHDEPESSEISNAQNNPAGNPTDRTTSGIRRVVLDEKGMNARFRELENGRRPFSQKETGKQASTTSFSKEKSMTEDRRGEALMLFERPQMATGTGHAVEMPVSVNDENAFRQTKISMNQRRMFKKMREQEEERPILFFEKGEFYSSKGALNSPMDRSNHIKQEEKDLITQNSESETDGSDEPVFDDNDKKSVMSEIFDWIKHVAIAIVIGLLLVIFIVQRNVVVGSSMEPNLYNNDQLFVQKVSRFFDSGISHGDIITINAEGLEGHTGDKDIIKRVIGLPGDTIDINADGVYRNGVMLIEDYLEADVVTDERQLDYSHVTLGPNQYFVLGDNRAVSLDSRVFGPIDKSRIIGEVLIRFYPFDKIGTP